MTSGDLQHIILTRYNLTGFGFAGNLDEDWLDVRLRLFTAYCVPSVVAQHEQKFVWFVFIDEKTPAHAREQLADTLPPNAQLVPLETSWDQTPVGPLLAKLGVSTETPLLSTRLDNDDGLAPTFTALVRRVAMTSHPRSGNLALNFPVGVQLAAGRPYGLIDATSPFMSLLETGPTRRTVLGTSHRNMRSIAKVRQIRSGPQWVQIVHDGNVDNSVRGLRIPNVMARQALAPLQLLEPLAQDPSHQVAKQVAQSGLEAARRFSAKMRRKHQTGGTR